MRMRHETQLKDAESEGENFDLKRERGEEGKERKNGIQEMKKKLRN